MLEASLADKINMSFLETSGHHLPDEFINMLLGLSFAPGGRASIKDETLHKGWSMIWLSLLYESQRASKIKREKDMAAAEENRSYNEQICIKRDTLPSEST